MTRTKADKARRRARQTVKNTPKRPNCPNPAKRAYDTESAVHKALRSSAVFGKPFRIYECRCGYLHLTKRVIPIKEMRTANV